MGYIYIYIIYELRLNLMTPFKMASATFFKSILFHKIKFKKLNNTLIDKTTENPAYLEQPYPKLYIFFCCDIL